MTQEDMGLSAMIRNLRQELEDIFGAANISDIENVYLYRGGPQLRDRVSHGLLSDMQSVGHDSFYACWMIYRLCCIPLLPHWKELAELIDR
jgi:hypothetical protein